MNLFKLLAGIALIVGATIVGIGYAIDRTVASVTITSSLVVTEVPHEIMGGHETFTVTEVPATVIGEPEMFTVTNAKGYRRHTAPDMGNIEYPLAFYSVHTLNAANAYSGGADIWFPGIIRIQPNDSVIYGVQFDKAYRIQIAMVEATEELDESLLGTGPLMQYESDIYEADDIVSFELNGVPALRIDNLSTGPSGEVTSDIIAIHEGRMYEFLVEPVGEVGGTAINGRNMIESILQSFVFEQTQ